MITTIAALLIDLLLWFIGSGVFIGAAIFIGLIHFLLFTPAEPVEKALAHPSRKLGQI